MSKIANPMKWAFDPDKSSIAALSHSAGRILWACIKCSHLADQHFDELVLKAAIAVDVYNPNKYKEFINLPEIQKLTGKGYGSYRCKRNDVFWQEVWEYITGKKELKHELI